MKGKHVLIGCGALAFLAGLAVIIGFAFLLSGNEGGVRTPIEMEEYATQFLEENNVLNETEQIRAYYDVTLSLDGTEAAIITDERAIYLRNGEQSAIAWKDVLKVNHRKETLIGDVFDIVADDGNLMHIEVAPLNGGQTFKMIVDSVWQEAKQPKLKPHVKTEK